MFQLIAVTYQRKCATHSNKQKFHSNINVKRETVTAYCMIQNIIRIELTKIYKSTEINKTVYTCKKHMWTFHLLHNTYACVT